MRKSFITFALLFVFAFSGSTQDPPAAGKNGLTYGLPRINKNDWMLGGRGKLSFSSQNYINDEKIKETSFRLSPRIGYFVADRWAIGLSPSFEAGSTEIPSYGKDKYNELGLGINSRYYLMENKNKTNFFAEAGYSFGGAQFNDDDRIGVNGYNLGLNFVYFKNPFVALELGFEYGSKKYEDEDERINKFGLCAGLQIHLDPCGRRREPMISKL